MNFGDKIIFLRKQKNMSQADLSKAVGVSREIIGRYERNEALPSIEVAKKIADTFDVSMDYLVGEGVNSSFDKQTLKRMQDIASFPDDDKTHILYTLDALIKNVKLKLM